MPDFKWNYFLSFGAAEKLFISSVINVAAPPIITGVGKNVGFQSSNFQSLFENFLFEKSINPNVSAAVAIPVQMEVFEKPK